MTGRQLKAIRRRLGLTQAKLARRINVRVESVSRWERGASGISGTAGVLMKLLHAHPELADELAEPRGTAKK